MTLTTLERSQAEALDDLSAAVWDWFLAQGLERFAHEEPGEVDPEVLSDWVEDAVRADLDPDRATILLLACRLADWDQLAAWATAELADDDLDDLD